MACYVVLAPSRALLIIFKVLLACPPPTSIAKSALPVLPENEFLILVTKAAWILSAMIALLESTLMLSSETTLTSA